MKEQYTIQAKYKYEWVHVTSAPLFDTEEEARKWGQWNYREGNGGKEDVNWRIVKL